MSNWLELIYAELTRNRPASATQIQGSIESAANLANVDTLLASMDANLISIDHGGALRQFFSQLQIGDFSLSITRPIRWLRVQYVSDSDANNELSLRLSGNEFAILKPTQVIELPGGFNGSPLAGVFVTTTGTRRIFVNLLLDQ